MNKQRIAEFFFLRPTARLRVRQIEREVKVPLPSAIRYARELEREGILQRAVIADVKLYAADRTSARFLLEKRLFNLRCLTTSGLIDFLKQYYHNSPMVLFGSYAKGEDIETSDIDVYLQTTRTDIPDLAPYEKKLRREIQLFCHASIRELKNPNLANNVLNGVTLNGFIEVFDAGSDMGRMQGNGSGAPNQS